MVRLRLSDGHVRRLAPGRHLPQWVLTMVLVACCSGPPAHGALGAPEPQYPFGTHALAHPAGTIQPSDSSRASLHEVTAAFYNAWKARYLVNGCGANRYYVYVNADRVGSGIDRRSISVSEGHGYGMLITALMAGFDPNARLYFDGLYRFFKDHPSNVSPYLMAWNQARGCGNMPNDGADSATDGDLDIAYALILADRQWGSGGGINYLQEAIQVINAIRQQELNPTTSLLLMGGFAKPSSARYYYGTRSSDFMPDHLRAFQAVTQDGTWARAIDAGYGLIYRLQVNFSPTAGLIPDFIENTNGSPRPASPGYLESSRDGRYSYNACRVPWRLATDYLISGDRRALRSLEPINAWIRRETGEDPARIRDGYDLRGAPLSRDTSMAFVGPFAVSAMVGEENQRWLNALWRFIVDTPVSESDYYGNTIKMLAMIVISGNWWAP